MHSSARCVAFTTTAAVATRSNSRRATGGTASSATVNDMKCRDVARRGSGSGARRAISSGSLEAAVGEGSIEGGTKQGGGLEKLLLERPVDRVRLPPGRGLRVHCLSDLHTDYKVNQAW